MAQKMQFVDADMKLGIHRYCILHLYCQKWGTLMYLVSYELLCKLRLLEVVEHFITSVPLYDGTMTVFQACTGHQEHRENLFLTGLQCMASVKNEIEKRGSNTPLDPYSAAKCYAML